MQAQVKNARYLNVNFEYKKIVLQSNVWCCCVLVVILFFPTAKPQNNLVRVFVVRLNVFYTVPRRILTECTDADNHVFP